MVKDFKTIGSKRYTIEVEGIVSVDKYKFRLRVFLQGIRIVSYPVSFPETFVEDKTPHRKDLDCLEKIVLRLVKDHLKVIINPPTYQKAFEHRLKSWFAEANRQMKEEEMKEK